MVLAQFHCVDSHGEQFYEYGGGSVFEIAASINGVQYSPSTPVATPKTSSSASGSSGDNAALPALTTRTGLLVGVSVVVGVMTGASLVL